MDDKQRKTLEKVIKQFGSLLTELEELLESNQSSVSGIIQKNSMKHFSIDETVKRDLISKGRAGAEQYLKELNSKDIGIILRKIGGSSEDGKKPKEVKINNILYKLFDFNINHSIIKGDKN